MRSPVLRLLTSAVALAWILAQGQSVAMAMHVAEEHAHDGHEHAHHHAHDHEGEAPGAGECADELGSCHAHGVCHVHALPDVFPGVRTDGRDGRDGRAAPTVVPGAGLVIASDPGTAARLEIARRPHASSSHAPAILRL